VWTWRQALEFCTQQQLIHRDLKPSHILFVRGAPKLADIGLSQALPPTPRMFRSSAPRDTFRRKGRARRRRNVFSLGKGDL